MLPVFSLSTTFMRGCVVGALCLLVSMQYLSAATKSKNPTPVIQNPAPGEAQLPSLPAEVIEVRAIAQTGAYRLALSLIDKYQTEKNIKAERWMNWEKERIQILRLDKNWTQIEKRMGSLPEGLPDTFKRWAMTEQAHAFMKLGQGQAALQLLRTLIWSLPVDHEGSDELIRQWRRGILDAYLSIGAIEDAYLAAVHYFRDYGNDTNEDRLLRARILIGSGRSEQAVDLLSGESKGADSEILSLLAQLRSQNQSAKNVLSSALRRVRSTKLTEAEKNVLWAVIAEAAKKSGQLGTHTNALEHVLTSSAPLPDGLFLITADSLWQAYLGYAQSIGNQSRFLIGQDKPWFDAAKKATKKTPVRSRSLYAFLSIHGETEESRANAVDELITRLKGRQKGGMLMTSLYMESQRFADINKVPVEVRHTLVDVALSRSDISMASALMATLQLPPDDVDAYFWHLRRARILVMGGEYAAAAKALEKLLFQTTNITEAQLEKMLQVIFDLQTVQEHQLALGLFEKVIKLTDNATLQRELYYWMAESSKALQQYQTAAQLYLKSAMHPDPERMDPWAQTARYQAADSLSKAGMVRDARQLFEHLLRVTKDPTRRARLKKELQKLWLIKDRGEAS